MPSRCRGNMSKSSHESDQGDCQGGACEPFRRLGTVSDYTGLLDAVVKFKAWKENVFKPIVEDLGVSLHTLKATNHLLHELSQLVTSSVSTHEFDDVVCNIESQLQTLGEHMSTLRNAPEKLLRFKQKTIRKMEAIKKKYTSTMTDMNNVVRKCPQPRKPDAEPVRRHIVRTYPRPIIPQYPRPTRRRIIVVKKKRRCHKKHRDKSRRHRHKKHHHKHHHKR